MSKALCVKHILGLTIVLGLTVIPGLTAGCSMAMQTASNSDATGEQSSAPDATPSTSSASSASSASSGEYACEPTAMAGRLEADATLSDRPGRYHLILVADSSEVADSSGAVATDANRTFRRAVSGLLILYRQALDADSSDPSDPSSNVSTPLYGFTDVDPESVGAHRVGDPGSRDPSAPGVLVLEREEYGRPIITLRLGSLANRPDLVRYDGAYTVLSVRKIDEEGFAGTWRSGGDVGFTVTTGYFCARQLP